MKGILFDLDGVLYTGSSPIPGASSVIKWINQNKIPHMFVSNTTSKSPSRILDKLHSMNIEAAENQLWTPVKAVSRWLTEQQINGPIALFLTKNAAEEFSHFEITDSVSQGIKAIVVGDMVGEWTIDRLNLILRMLLESPDAILVALGMTRYYLAPDGFRLDVGSIIKAFEYATGRVPMVAGKPSSDYFHTALHAMGVLPENAIMIGDDILSDIGGAQNVGIKGILVKTGKFMQSDLYGEIKPDVILNSISDLPEWCSQNGFLV